MKTILKSKYRAALYQLGGPKARKPHHQPTTQRRKSRFDGTIRRHLKK
jgi:hypothetical protein